MGVIISKSEFDANLDHAIVQKISAVESRVIVSVKLPICEVRTEHMASKAWKYAFAELDAIFESVRNLRNYSLESGENVSLESWNDDDALMHMMSEDHFEVESIDTRIQFDYSGCIIR